MNNYVVEIWNDEGAACTFYTVRWDDVQFNETDKFFEKYDALEEFEVANMELLNFVVKTIGEDHGDHDALFNREENEVIGLPVQGNVKISEVSYHFPQFPLRIYALKITENIVILFNGGVKDGSTNQESSLNMQWREACQFARTIVEAIQDEIIIVKEEERKLLYYTGSEEIIL